MDEEQLRFLDTFRRFMDELVNVPRPVSETRTPLGAVVQEFLGADVTTLPVVSEELPPHRLVDADIALELIAAASDSHLLGVTGGQQREHSSFQELLHHAYVPFAPGPAEYVSSATGAETSRQVVSFAVRLLHIAGRAVAVLQRGPRPEYGRGSARIEVLASDPAGSALLLSEVRRLMLEHSVLRGQVLSFTGNEYGPGAAGADFLVRPTVPAADVILSPGVLDGVVSHVVGIGEHSDALRAAGQHLKRGVLLYGPPGTGKTLTIRHLLSRTPGITAVLLTGNSIRFITEAAELARAMQPAIVVLEDVDLIASDRGMYGPQPLLFAVLDALDGLDADADVAFILTTNRVEVLEPALAERPGRVDLAVEIPLPDVDSRRRLFARYADGLPLSPAAVTAAADRAEGVTGSFAKELMRRTVLLAAQESRAPTDADLETALEGLLSGRERLTRSLLGSPDAQPDADGVEFGPATPAVGSGYVPLRHGHFHP